MAMLEVKDIVNQTGIPAASIRRYFQYHGEYLSIKKKHKSYEMPEESMPILEMIRDLYSQGKERDSINEILEEKGFKPTYEIATSNNNPQRQDFNEKIDNLLELNKKQEEFNKMLVEALNARDKKLEEQQKYIIDFIEEQKKKEVERDRKIEERDQILMETLKLSQDKLLLETKNKGFFKRLFNK